VSVAGKGQVGWGPSPIRVGLHDCSKGVASNCCSWHALHSSPMIPNPGASSCRLYERATAPTACRSCPMSRAWRAFYKIWCRILWPPTGSSSSLALSLFFSPARLLPGGCGLSSILIVLLN